MRKLASSPVVTPLERGDADSEKGGKYPSLEVHILLGTGPSLARRRADRGVNLDLRESEGGGKPAVEVF